MKFNRVFVAFFSLYLAVFTGSPTLAFFSLEEIPYIKGGGCDDSRVRASTEMMRALKHIRDRINQAPVLVSCFRDQTKQNSLRRRFPGRAAKVSHHTHGIAVDIQIPGVRGDAICQFLSEVRTLVLGGVGGVGAYPGGTTGHLDTRNYTCAWNRCEKMGCSLEYNSERVDQYIASLPGSASDWFLNRWPTN